MKKIVVSLVTVLMVLLSLAGCTSSKDDMKYFATMTRRDQMLVFVEWDTTRPEIKLRSPSGRIFSPGEDGEHKDGTITSITDNMMYFCIEDAEAGDWYISYDKMDNKTVTVELDNANDAGYIKDKK